VVRHREGFPDEVQADSYLEEEDDLVFIQGGAEVLRIPLDEVVSVAPKRES
jgi:hypothetical protein